MFAACGQSGDSEPADNAGTEGAGTESPQTLTVWCWDPTFNINAMQVAEKIYQRDHPDFKLNIEEVSNSDIETRLTTLVTSGELDQLPDIFLNQNGSFQKYVINFPEMFTELTDSVIDFDQFAQSYVALSSVDGKHYGVPFDNSAAIFGIRTDVLEQAGYTLADFTDLTWSEYIEKATDVREKTGKALLSDRPNEPDTIMMLLGSAGSSLFNADGSPNIKDNAELKTAIGVYIDLIDKGLVKTVNSWDEYIASFVNGDVAGTINGCWILGSIQSAEDQSGKWGITNMPKLEIPGGTNYASNGGSSWAVSSNANTELAIDFLAATFGGSTELYDEILPSGALGLYLPAADSAAYGEPQPYFGDEAIFSRIAEYAGKIPPSNTGIYYYDARTAVATAVQNIIGGADMDAELAAAEDTVSFAMGN
jgi:lactose/L-arabinose transport system substrate-binding protein